MGYNRPRFPIPNDLRLHEQLPINNQSPTLPDSNTMGASIFETPISTKPPLDIFQKKLHEVNLPKNFVKINNNKAVETNKFYGNMFLDRQDNPVWTHPYSIWWSRDNFQGMAVSHIKKEQRVFGPPDAGDPAQYYFSPTGIKSFVFSYAEDINSMELGFENARHMSIETKLMKSENEYIRFPLIQGMGFVTAIYYNLTPKFYSQVGFRDIQAMPPPRAGMQKYKLLLENNVSWNLYISSSDTEITLTRVDGNTLVANKFCNKAVFQIVADTIAEIDNAAGCYPVDVNLNGSVASDIGLGQYSFVYVVEGNSNSGCSLLYALPHHLSTFTQGTLSKIIPTQLDSTTYGLMQGLITNILQLQVETPSDILFAPKRSTFNGGTESAKYSPDVLSSISKAATLEVETSNVLAETNLDSMYFSGKALAKYAWILYSCYYVLEDLTLTKKLLPELETALQKFIENKQILPLQYDTTWGGLVSSGTNAQDFGNSYYNDHHFHYGYHIITAAIIGQIEKELSGNSNWLLTNKDWVECLLRDYANPNINDDFFPVFRSFDWFGGHSWAKGLFASGDGKDQESSSEDANAAYAIKLWGHVTNNENLQNIGDLMLGIMKVSFNDYFLYTDDNKVEPPNFIKNKVSGIFFENKIDHTTYFGTNIEYIQMIHAIPIIPCSSFIRSPEFVRQEYEEKLAPVVNNINDGWKGIVMLNLALYDPKASFAFFNTPNFNRGYLDGGQSLTWSLVYSGGFV